MATTYLTQAQANEWLGISDPTDPLYVTEAEILTAEEDLDDMALGYHINESLVSYRSIVPANYPTGTQNGISKSNFHASKVPA